jgi:osmotically-inducible protein OsmY
MTRMESAINVSVDKGCLRLIGEIPVASSREDLEAFVMDISLQLLGNKKMPKLPSFGLRTKEFTETEAAVYIGRSKAFLRKCRAEGRAGGHQRGPKYTRDSERTIRYPLDELDKWLSSRAKYEANCDAAQR